MDICDLVVRRVFIRGATINGLTNDDGDWPAVWDQAPSVAEYPAARYQERREGNGLLDLQLQLEKFGGIDGKVVVEIILTKAIYWNQVGTSGDRDLDKSSAVLQYHLG